MTEDLRAGNVAGFCSRALVGVDPGLSESVMVVAELCLSSCGMGFLSTVDALLPIFFRCTGELDSSSWKAWGFAGDGVVA